MYRALESMKVRGPTGATITLMPGDVIADFDDWTPWTQRALLDEKRVRWAPEGLSEPEKVRAAKEAVRAGFSSRPGHEAVAGEFPADTTSLLADTNAPTTAPVDVSQPESLDALTCTVCQRSGFKDASGLKIHMARAHKGA